MNLGADASTGSDDRATSDTGTTAPSFGRRTLLAGAAGTAAGVATAMLGAPAEAATGQSVYEPIAPSLRLAETRPDYGPFGFTNVGPRTIRVGVAGRTVNGVTIPADATAAVLTVVAINLTAGGGYLTAYPSRTALPNASNLNFFGFSDTVNNLATVKLGSDGAVELYTSLTCYVVVDLVGVYRAASGPTRAGRFEPLGGLGGTTRSAQRIFSPEANGVTRDGQVIDVDVTGLIQSGLVEPDATALAVNLTIDQPWQGGYAAAYPYGESQPSTSSLNYGPFTTRAASSFVRIGTHPRTGRRGFHVFILRGARFFVDATGYITGPGATFETTAGQFVPRAPQRILDTRSATSWMRGIGGKKRLFAGWTRRFRLPSDVAGSAGAVAVNVTIAGSMGAGYLTLLPARTPREFVSNVNSFGPGQVAANHAVTPVSTEGLEVFSSSGAAVVCDLIGYYVGSAVPTTMPVVPDPPPPPIAAPYTLDMPRLGKTREMASGAAWLVDSGRIWHWTGTGMVGQGAMIGAFGHRTDAGGPLRNLHYLGSGDVVTLDTADQRRYYYRYVGRDITNSSNSQILSAAAEHPGEVLALIACTVGYDRAKGYPGTSAWAPTSLKYRIIVRMELIGWDDISPTPY